MGADDSTLGLIFEIGADPSKGILAVNQFSSEARKALAEFEESIASTMTKSLGITKEFAVGMAVGAGAVIGLTAAMFELSMKAAEAGAKIYEMSEKTGLGAEQLSGLSVLAKETGENFDSLAMALGRAGTNLEKAIINPGAQSSKILADVMGSAKNLADVGLKPMDDRVQEVLAHIFAMNDVGERNLALTALLGRGWQTNFETLKLLAEQGYAPAIEQAKNFGVFFDEDSARKAREFEVEWSQVKLTLGSVAMVLGRDLIPAMSGLLREVLIQMEYWGPWGKMLWEAVTMQGPALVNTYEHMRSLSDITKEVDANIKALIETQKKAGEGGALGITDPDAAKRAAEAVREANKAYEDGRKEDDEANKIYWQTIDDREKQELQAAKDRDKEESAAYTENLREKERENGIYWATLDAREKQEVEDAKKRDKEESDAYAAYRQEEDRQNKIYWQTVDAQNSKGVKDEHAALQQRIQMFNQLANVASAAFSHMSGAARIWADVTLQTIREIVTAVIEKNLTEQKDITSISLLKAGKAAGDAYDAAAAGNFWAAAKYTAAAVAYGSVAAAPIAALAIGSMGGGGGNSGGSTPSGGGSSDPTAGGVVSMAPGTQGRNLNGTVHVIVSGSNSEVASHVLGLLDNAVRFQGGKLTASHTLRNAPVGARV